MEILIEYLWVLLMLVALEGLLAADNAVVMAVMVKDLPKEQQKKALFYGLVGAFVFRFAALFMIVILVNYWQIQALGAIYLIFMSLKNLFFVKKESEKVHNEEKENSTSKKGFWLTVLKVEIADIAFAIDSMLAAVVLAVTLPEWGDTTIAGINIGQFVVIFIGGIIGLILMRFAATAFIKVLDKYPALEKTAFVIVGWVGVKLAVLSLGHEKLAIIDTHFPHSTLWKVIFWSVLLLIIVIGLIVSKVQEKNGKIKE